MADALLIIDVQNDFMPPDGALAVACGDEVIEPINALARSGSFDLIIATRDWHPPDHHSFRGKGGPWPEHCVRDTPGAQLASRLERDAIALLIDKCTPPGAPPLTVRMAPAGAARALIRARSRLEADNEVVSRIDAVPRMPSAPASLPPEGSATEVAKRAADAAVRAADAALVAANAAILAANAAVHLVD